MINIKPHIIKTSTKLNAQYLGQLLKYHGCRQIVVAPGSRNAPLIITFDEDSDYRCVSVPDERSAAFTALGMTLETREPVAVVCSSGSATVNFYPAAVEAFYQKLPLILISADRPTELADQAVGQTIRQEGVFGNHIVFEANLLRDPKDRLAKAYNQRVINEAMIASARGPVHINVPFDEPLYEVREGYEEKVKTIDEVTALSAGADLRELVRQWKESPKVMLLAGQMMPDRELEKALDRLNERSPFLVLSETVSNLQCSCNVRSIDRLINTISEEEKKQLQPDLLITMGGEIVSKMVKQFVRDFPPAFHWHLSSNDDVTDTFQQLTTLIKMKGPDLFRQLEEKVPPGNNHKYLDYWVERDHRKSFLHSEYLADCGFSDLVAFGQVLDNLPSESRLHTANSASVRYSQLFDQREDILHFANRGTSGIDGCTSTAVGHAMVTDKPVTLITGDVAFLYDSNAFWNDELPANLRVIILNNNGGNIFRIISGPDGSETFERFQETVHDLDLKGVADIYRLEFKSAGNYHELQKILQDFYHSSNKPKILEIKTPRTENPGILKNYFKYLRNG